MIRSGRSRSRNARTCPSSSRSHDAVRGTATVCPAASRRDTRCRPRNPVPPVTTYFIGALPLRMSVCCGARPCSAGVAPRRALLDERDHAHHLADALVEGDRRVIAERVDLRVRDLVVALVEVLADVGLVEVERLQPADRL